jgi:UPF0716 protein FxsA
VPEGRGGLVRNSLFLVFILLLLIAWGLAELFVAIKVAETIGVLETVLLLIVTWPLGVWALRTQGRAAWRRLSAAVAEGRPPGREVLDGVLIVIGGLLLIIPGFIADIVGVLALLPPTRWLLRRPLERNLQSRVVVSATRFGTGGRPYDVDSTASDVDPPQLRP